MSKLQELIKGLCPKGVEFRKLGEVCEIFSGKNKQKNDEGEYPVYGSTGIIAYCDNYKYSKEQLLIARVGANAGFTHIAKGKYDVSDNTLIVDVIGGNCLKYIYYLLVNLNLNKYSKGGGQPLVTAGEIKVLEIPLPPLEVQNEIVRILDTFTSHTAELQANLQARKEQYEYYRNKLLTFDENDEGVKWMKLGEICDILTGFPFDSSKFVAEGIRLMRGVNIKRGMLDFNEEINRYWDNSEGLEKYILEENDIVISMDGSLVGKSFAVILKEHLPLLLVQRVARLRSTSVNIKYVYFNITNSFSEYVDKVKTKGAIPHISLKNISNFMIPVPPLSEQQRIVSILDKFESLVNDLTAGLPAEIAAVQEQYEYYRNKLLSFKRIS